VRPAETIHRLGGAYRHLVKEIGAFGVVGSACFLIDVGLFQLLYAHVGLGAVTSKFLATAVSMTVAYVGHRYWSFSHRARPGLRQEYARFTAINVATLLLGLGVVAFVRYGLDQESALVLQVANVGSIVLGTLIRYLSYRRWVFPARRTVVDDELARVASTPV
jgi:putative flippase GtrA